MDEMVFQGVRIGYLDIVGKNSEMLGRLDHENGILALIRMWEIIATLYEATTIEHEAFIRVLIFDKIEKINLGLRTKSEFLLGLLGYLALVFDTALSLGADILYSYWESFLAVQAKDIVGGTSEYEVLVIEPENRVAMQNWVADIFDHIWDRRFFISSLGSMGLASEEVAEGDIICIPLGCCHPIVLRKVSDYYVNLGEAYVDGFMYGEAMEMLERRELKLEEFKLH
jgi:hypothetical protein